MVANRFRRAHGKKAREKLRQHIDAGKRETVPPCRCFDVNLALWAGKVEISMNEFAADKMEIVIRNVKYTHGADFYDPDEELDMGPAVIRRASSKLNGSTESKEGMEGGSWLKSNGSADTKEEIAEGFAGRNNDKPPQSSDDTIKQLDITLQQGSLVSIYGDINQVSRSMNCTSARNEAYALSGRGKQHYFV